MFTSLIPRSLAVFICVSDKPVTYNFYKNIKKLSSITINLIVNNDKINKNYKLKVTTS